MNNDFFMRIILQHVANTLKPGGFHQSGSNFVRDDKATCLVIYLQKSRSSTETEVLFTLNLGIFL